MNALPPGFSARPVDPATDVPAIFDLCTAASIHDRGVPDVTERMVREAYALPSFVAATDSQLVLDDGGRAGGVYPRFR